MVLDDDEETIQSSVSLLFFVVPLLAALQVAMPSIIKKLVSLIVASNPMELKLVAQIKELKLQQSQISMMDEFAKHAKLERQMIKLRSELQSLGDTKASERSHAASAFKFTFYALLALASLLILVSSGGQPLLLVHPDSFFPLGWFFSLPTGVSGAIGLPCWSLVSRSVFKSLQKHNLWW